MKTKKGSSAIRSRSSVASARHTVKRPLHKRVLLHPFSAFVLLCVGVLVAGSTFRGGATSYDVTATVPAPSLVSPAFITSPTSGQRVTTAVVNITGSCPAQSYVKLYRGNTFSGAVICDNGGFALQVNLSLGANELRARVFNTTDQEGPSSSPITVYYDLPAMAKPPAQVPTTLRVSSLDEENYAQGSVKEVVGNPTISGFAPPFSDITVTFYSEPSVCRTKANGQGVWICTLANALPPGIHHVVITATTVEGKKLTFPTFEVRVVQYAQPFVVTSDYAYTAHREGQTISWKLAISGGTAPYDLAVDWGDGSTAHIVQQDQVEFAISHIYNSSELTGHNYPVIIRASDARGATTVLQLAAVIQGAAVPVANKSMFATVVSGVQRWLWVVWPVYIGVVLMACSFWIGERDAYQRLVGRRRRAH